MEDETTHKYSEKQFSKIIPNIHVIVIIIFDNILYLTTIEKEWKWLAVDIYRTAKQRGKYLPLATDTKVNSCFSIY